MLIGAVLTVIAVAWHYWALGALFRLMPSPDAEHSHFMRALGVLLLMVLVHLIEVLWSAGGLVVAKDWLGLGDFTDPFTPTFRDYFYFSLVTYSTLGLSEFSPTGMIKVLTGLESLLGFILLTWSASFFYTLMGRQERG